MRRTRCSASRTAPGCTPAAVAQRLDPHSAVVYIMWVTGRFDLLVEVVCDEEIELANFLNAAHSRSARHRARGGHDPHRHVQEPVSAQAPRALGVRHPARGCHERTVANHPGSRSRGRVRGAAAGRSRAAGRAPLENVDERTGKPHEPTAPSDRGDRCPQIVAAALGDMTAELDCPHRLRVELVAPGP